VDGGHLEGDIDEPLWSTNRYEAAVQTQKGIIEYAEGMAQVLAKPGRASQKVTGDHPSVAIKKWSKVIEKRALELVKQDVKKLTCV